MNEEQFDDLKQFITSTVSQSETRLKQELASKAEVRDGFAGVGEAIEALAADMDERFNEVNSVLHRHTTEIEGHERRLTGLEHVA